MKSLGTTPLVLPLTLLVVSGAGCCTLLRDARSETCPDLVGHAQVDGFVLGGGAHDEGSKNRQMAVRLMGGGRRCTWKVKTGQDGAFTLKGLPPGKYEIWPVASDCLQRAERFEVREDRESVAVYAIEHPDNLVLE
jgi:hypothetical protein